MNTKYHTSEAEQCSGTLASQAWRCTLVRQATHEDWHEAETVVSPVRIRVPPLTKVLQMRCTGSGSVTAETVTPPDSSATSIYITSTSPGEQCHAMVCKPGKRNRLRHADFAILCKARKPPSSHS